jgi:hypothetical protein
LAARTAEAASFASQAPAELLQLGSGWGALEVRMRRGGLLDRRATPFPAESMGAEQAPWWALVESDSLSPADPGSAPVSYQVSPGWSERLERSEARDWSTWLHRGVARHYAGDVAGAASAWRESLDATPNAWSLRNLAVVAESGEASHLLRRAVALAPEQPALLVELLEVLLAADRPIEALAAVDAVDPAVGDDPLVRFLEASAAVTVGDLDRGARILEAVTMPWVREGSRSLDDLWFRLEAGRVAARRGVSVDEALLAEVRRETQLPYAYDFRMSPPPEP